MALAQIAAARGISGWRRLVTSIDPAERAALRLVLTKAIEIADEREAHQFERLGQTIQESVAKAFGGKKGR